jgi:hypothetical protein
LPDCSTAKRLAFLVAVGFEKVPDKPALITRTSFTQESCLELCKMYKVSN